MRNIQVENKNNVLTIILNRPERHNALNFETLLELQSLLVTLPRRFPDTRCVILTGHGDKAFSAGADLKELSTMSPKQGEELSFLAQEVTLLLEALPVPIIASVNGVAMGGGLELALACDFIYTCNQAQLALPEVSLGLIPGFGGCVRLGRRVGMAKAKELIFTGNSLTGEEAQIIGLSNKNFENSTLLKQGVLQTALAISSRGPKAVATAKYSIEKGAQTALRAGLEMERKNYRRVLENSESTEGMAAFLEKRAPSF